MRRNWLIGLMASTLGLAQITGTALAQTPPIPLALPDSGSSGASPANLAIDIQRALASQPSSGPEGGVPINLAAALRLAGATPLDIAAASARLEQAVGLLIQAKALKIPNLNGGLGYYRHDGVNQNLFTGQVFQKGTQRACSSAAGRPSIVGLADAIFAPLAARRVVARVGPTSRRRGTTPVHGRPGLLQPPGGEGPARSAPRPRSSGPSCWSTSPTGWPRA